MDDDKVLGHLLEIESEAAALVSDAQGEADRRVAEGENLSRAGYEERYRKEVEKLEGEFQKATNAVKEQYQKELDAYRNKLNSLESDTAGFAAYLEQCIAGAANG